MLTHFQVIEVETQTSSSLVCSLLTFDEHLFCSPLQKAEELLVFVVGFILFFLNRFLDVMLGLSSLLGI